MSSRTFKPRRRRMSPTRQRRFDELAPYWVLETVGEPLDLESVFGSVSPVVLDIGIGRGESCIEMADADPSTNVIGVDVHTPGIAAAVLAIDERGLSNLRLVEGDVFEFVTRLALGSVAGLRVFFPDPWPKARHHRRRIITTERLAMLLPVLADGGWLHLATDIDDYAEQMQQVCDAHPRLIGGPIERPDSRPVTRYERRGLEAGRTITDLCYHT